MNQNMAYFTQSNIDPRQGSNNGQANFINADYFPQDNNTFQSNSTTYVASTNQGQQITLSENPTSISQQRITTTAVPVSVSNATGPATVHVQLVPPNSNSVGSQQHIIIAAPQMHPQSADPDDRRMAAFMEYFVEQQPQCSAEQHNSGVAYPQPAINAKYAIKSKLNSSVSLDKTERDMLKRAKQAEAARQRYHRLTPDEKRDLNLKRTLAQKRKRQREKELSELEQILRMTNDIVDDPEVTEQLREKRMRARWAEAARTRYQRMSSEERRQHNTKRRMRQSVKNDKGEPDDEATRQRIKEQNQKKAEAARLRYHRMSNEEKKLYNQRRTEAFRRRRMEEEALLAMPIGRINGEALDRAQQIVVRNAKRAEAARLRYQRMTPEQRKLYNQKRYTPKRKREPIDGNTTESPDRPTKAKQQHEFDALSSLERDVIRRTQQAQQALIRQRQQQGQQQQQGVVIPGTVPGTASYQTAPGGGPTLGATLAAQNQLQQQQPQAQLSALQLAGTQGGAAGRATHQVGQHPIQLQYTTGGMVVGQQHLQQPQLITTYATQHPN